MSGGRKTECVTIPASWGGRDAGNVYLITEWPAMRAEKWAARMFIALKGTSGHIPDSVATMGMVGVALAGLNAFLASDVDVDALEPLMDQMLECVQIVRDPRHPDVATAIVSDDDIAELRTLLHLRSEVVRVHTGFSPAEALSTLTSAIKAATEISSST